MDSLQTRSRPEVTFALTRGVARLFLDLGLVPITELALPNGRRADVAGLDDRGRLFIAEVKSSREDFAVDRKWADYLPYCDGFYFAVGEAFPVDLLPCEEGLIVADGYGGEIVRGAQSRPLAGARRKAMTIRFARHAALRCTNALISAAAE